MKELHSSVPAEIPLVVRNSRVPLYSAIRQILTQASWWQQTLALAMAALIFIYAAGWLGATLLPPSREWGDGVPSLRGIAPDNLPWLFVRWDSGYYWDIATKGYRPDGDERAFYPLYPVVVRALSSTSRIPMLESGLLVAVASFLGAGLIIYKWIRIDYGHSQAIWTTGLMVVFPMAFYLVAFYAEPLFLLLAVLSLYLARRGRFALSGVTIALAGATRPQAFLLGIPYVLEFWQQHDFSRKQWLQFLAGGLIAPIGMLGYLIFIAKLSNSSSLYETYVNLQYREWGNYGAWPWVTLGDGLNAVIFGANIQPDWFSRAFTFSDMTFALLGLALGVWAFRRMRASSAAYLLIGVIFFYSKHGPYGYAFHSFPRHLGSLPPIYLALALFLNQLPTRLRWTVVAVFVVFLGIFAAWFASGRWVS